MESHLSYDVLAELTLDDDSNDRARSVDQGRGVATQTSMDLETVLSDITEPRARVDRLNQLAWDGRLDDSKRSARFAALAHEASTSGEFARAPYLLGIAASLRTQAFLHNDVGNYTEALTTSLRSLELLGGEASGDPESGPIVIDVLGNISWTHRCYGDYAAAGEYGMRALGMAEERGDRLRQARLLNILGNIYADSNDLEAALQMGERSLRHYRDLGLRDGESVVLNNLALTYLELGNGAKALEACRESLRIADEGDLASVHLTALSTLGEIYLGIKDFVQAEAFLNQALALSRERGARYDEFLNLQNVGKVALGQHDAARARAYFEEALTLAEVLNHRVGQFQCHKLLADLHEQAGELADALRQFKTFHDQKETVFNENANKRLAGLRVMHQVETARRDSEIHYLRTIELKKEIEERKAAQAALEELVSLDPLTGLLNRREFHQLGEREVRQSLAHRQPLTVILFDIDFFKGINDTYGHATGDAALVHIGQVVRQSLREGELIGRYGGDEFVILLPGSSCDRARQIAERLRANLARQTLATAKGNVPLTLSMGIAELVEIATLSFDDLLVHADQALYAAKNSGRDRVVAYSDLPGRS